MRTNDTFKLSAIDIANRLNLPPLNGKARSCYNKSAHKNGDRNPSMVLYPHSFKCMSCGVHGNSIELVKQVLRFSSEDAIKWIKKESNTYSNSSTHSSSDKEPAGSKKITAKDIEIYNKLFAIAGGIDNRHWEYLKRRGFTKLVLEYGVTNVKDNTAQHLKGFFSMDELLHSGVFSISRKTNKPYFTFSYHTLLFPFYYLDNVVFVQGRKLESTKSKYRNLAKEILYPYNVNILLHSDVGYEDVLIAEGTIDTLTLLGNGCNAVGIIGSNNFKSEWVKLFDKYRAKPIIAFDNDNAGTLGAKKLVNTFKRSLIRYKPKNEKDWNAIR